MWKKRAKAHSLIEKRHWSHWQTLDRGQDGQSPTMGLISCSVLAICFHSPLLHLFKYRHITEINLGRVHWMISVTWSSWMQLFQAQCGKLKSIMLTSVVTVSLQEGSISARKLISPIQMSLTWVNMTHLQHCARYEMGVLWSACTRTQRHNNNHHIRTRFLPLIVLLHK